MSALQLDAEQLYLALLKGVKSLIADTPEPVYLAGITSGGAWLAERLQRDLGLDGDAGVISSSMHRDDFAQRGLALSAQTVLPFEVDGAHVILIDDVLYTGRTLRAVLARPRWAKSSRCMLDEITPASPSSPRSRCRRSASQAPPEVMPARYIGSGVSAIRLFTPFSKVR